jgi:hypothetical protein
MGRENESAARQGQWDREFFVDSSSASGRRQVAGPVRPGRRKLRAKPEKPL